MMKKLSYLLGSAALAGSLHGQVVINEVDADQTGTDSAEFVELYDGGVGSTDLTGYVLVFFNGSDNETYNSGTTSYDLDGLSTDANGFFLIGNVPGADLAFDGADNQIQNGADAVALYLDDATTFPNNTAVTATNLVDAVVYDTNDPDATGLLTVLTPGQPQINEGANGNNTTESIARKPDGGTALNTSTYLAGPPTPGAPNGSPAEAVTISLDISSIAESSLGVIQATLTRAGSSGNLDVSVSVDDDSEASLAGGTVTILDTQTSVTFDIFPVDDTYPDGDQTVTLSATPSGGGWKCRRPSTSPMMSVTPSLL